MIDKEAIIVIAEATALPGNEAVLRDAIDRVIEPSLAEPGVSVFRLHQDIEKPGHFALYERFADQTAIDSHFASSHFNAGPALIPGANLGGFDIQGTMWLKMRLGATANVRGYYGTTGVIPNSFGIHGPFVMEHLFMAGPSIRGPKNEHAALTFHALVGGSYGVFDSAVDNGATPQQLGLFSNGVTLATAVGGSLDLNRSPRWSLRISPDYLLTRFGGVSQNEFAISVGVLYRFRKMRSH